MTIFIIYFSRKIKTHLLAVVTDRKFRL